MGKIRIHITKKKIIAIGGVVLLLLAALGAGFFVWWLQHKDTLPSSNTFNKAAEKTLPDSADEAQSLAVAGKVEESNKKIQEALGKSDVGNDEKYHLLVQQGVNYSNGGEYQKAIDAYLEAEKVKSDFTVSHLTGEAYEALGNKTKAVEYYKKSLSQLDPKAISYTSDKRYYEARVKELGGQL